MSVSVLYEDFSEQLAGVRPSSPHQLEAATVDDDARRASFEDGYKEGWTDAQAASQNETSELTAEVATALQEAGFAYFEARQHIFNSMRPLLEAMVDQVVPAMARETFSLKIVEQLEKIASETEPPMQILCAPATAPELREVLAAHVSFPIEVRTEDTLTETQAVLKLPEGQAHIDLSDVVHGLKSAIDDFYSLNQQKDAINV